MATSVGCESQNGEKQKYENVPCRILKNVSFESTEAKTYTREKGHYTMEGVNTTNSTANRKGTKQNSTCNGVTR